LELVDILFVDIWCESQMCDIMDLMGDLFGNV